MTLLLTFLVLSYLVSFSLAHSRGLSFHVGVWFGATVFGMNGSPQTLQRQLSTKLRRRAVSIARYTARPHSALHTARFGMTR